MKRLALGVAILALAGCANGGLGDMFGGNGPGSFGARPASNAGDTAPLPGLTEPVVGEAAAADIAPANAEARAAAVAEGNTGTGDVVRGFTVASLGDATIPGLWIETPLVDRERLATVIGPDGTTVQVTARPTGGDQGSGSRLSLAAFQALGINLTSLPTVTVVAD